MCFIIADHLWRPGKDAEKKSFRTLTFNVMHALPPLLPYKCIPRIVVCMYVQTSVAQSAHTQAMVPFFLQVDAALSHGAWWPAASCDVEIYERQAKPVMVLLGEGLWHCKVAQVSCHFDCKCSVLCFCVGLDVGLCVCVCVSELCSLFFKNYRDFLFC